MTSAVPLAKPLCRRVGRLMVTVTEEGIELRGYRCRRRFRTVTWGELAHMATLDQPVISELEKELGMKVLRKSKADPFATIEKPEAAKK